jgi:arabinan endo-1,5-alpha-L-arabinosidase
MVVSHRWRRSFQPRRTGSIAVAVVLALGVLSGVTALAPAPAAQASHGTYTNPLDISSEVGPVENCADPTVTKAKNADGEWRWWMYCTKDPRNDADRQEGNPDEYEFQLIPIYSSKNLVDWRHRGNVFQPEDAEGDNYPDWVDPNAGLFAPEIKKLNGQWYLYYSVTDVTDATSGEPACGGDSAIGVATAPTPLGPWTDSGDPVIDPRRGGGGCNFFSTIDPEVQVVSGQKYIMWGSYYGGLFIRELSADGTESDEASQQRISTGNKFEGPEIIRRDGYYYLFVSATNCCNGPLTAYGVFAARSESITGPYVDREGISINDIDTDDSDPTTGAIGGTPVLQMNGNQWVGPGHNTVFKDFEGKHWTIYHAVDRGDPFYADRVGFTKRPPLMDPIVWVNDWPEVRAGRWASDVPMPAPAAQPGDTNHYRPVGPFRSNKGELIESASDEFEGSSLGGQWSWVREPDPSTYEVTDGRFELDTQGELFQQFNDAPILVQEAPNGEWLLEARMRLTVPPEGCCTHFAQGGVVLYDHDDKYLKLSVTSIFETRQVEWAKEVPADTPQPGYPRYGNAVVGPPGDTGPDGDFTTLRIVRTIEGGHEEYQAWSKRDGGEWVRGATWQHKLGEDVQIGLISMNRNGFESQFDWVRVYRLNERTPVPTGEF